MSTTPTDAGFHVYDTTLRDGAQQEGLNLSVADKLDDRAPARRPRGRLHRGRLARREPQGHRVLPPRRRRARPAPRHARGLRRDPPGRGAGRRRPAGRGAARQRRRRRHAGREVPRPARRAGAAHHARGEPRDGPRHRQPPARRGAAGVPGRGALLRRLPRQPRLRARGAADGVRRGRRGRRAVRHQRRDAAVLGRDVVDDVLSSTGVRVGIHCHNDTGCAVANTLAAVDAGASHVQGTSTATASAPATPTWSPSSPTSSSSWTAGCCRRAGCARPPGSRTRSPT